MFREFIQFTHIFAGIIWLGGILFVGWGVYPVANKALETLAERKFLYTLMKHIHHLLTLAGTFVIITGIILGTVLGPIKEMSELAATYYGQLFLTALLLALFGLLWGALISYRTTMKMLRDNYIWDAAVGGNKKPLQKRMQLVTAISAVEVVCLTAVIYIMVLI